MANRAFSARRLKLRRSYDVREAAKAIGATPQTIRKWISDGGLSIVKGVYPAILRGVDLIDFLNARKTARKQPCGAGRLYCLRCKTPKAPAFDEVEFRADGPKLGTLTGLCPDCAGLMHRRTSRARLKAATGNLKVSMPNQDSRLSQTPEPLSNPHFER